MSGPGYRLDSDGDVEMSIPQPIFEVIRAPELSSWDHAALIEWYREWEHYVEKIRHRCTTAGETFENVVATVKGCLKPKTLKNLATYVLKKPLTSVTDADVMNAVKVRCCHTPKNEFVPDVTSLFRQKLKMGLSGDDCDARVFRYYEDFNGIVEDNGLQKLIGTGNESEAGYKSRRKACCRILADNLQPPVLKAQTTRLIDLERRDCRSDDVALFDLVLEHAKVQQRFHRLSRGYATQADTKAGRPAERKSQRPGTVTHATSTPATASAAAQPSRSSQPAQRPRSSNPPPHDGCLFCKGPQWMKDSPTATDAQRTAARERFQAFKEQSAGALRSKVARHKMSTGSVCINSLLTVPYVPDTGADRSVIPKVIAASLRAVQPTLSTIQLSTHVEAEIADGRQLICDQELLLDLELTTVAGLVSLRSVSCLVLGGDGDELLLGRDVLKGLGIDVDQQLAQLTGSTPLDNAEDEFPVGDALPDPQPDTESIISLSQLLDRAVANGLPEENVDTVRGFLEEFPDVWREAVGADPPADVKRLLATLRPGAVPHRSPRASMPLYRLLLFENT